MKTPKRVNEVLSGLLLLLVLSGLTVNLHAQSPEKLSRSIPELEGVSSAGIIDFLNAIDTGRQEIHSFMFLRHGKVIADGWWNPYGPDYSHVMYSASKTFTATAIGLAVSENKLKITDKVISFFPYSLPDKAGEFMKELTVRDLLTMSVGQDPEPRTMGTMATGYPYFWVLNRLSDQERYLSIIIWQLSCCRPLCNRLPGRLFSIISNQGFFDRWQSGVSIGISIRRV